MSSSAPSRPFALTVVIPLLRQVDAWLEQAVRSALDQSVPCGVIVVTAPATPETNRAVLRRLVGAAPERLLVAEQVRPGFAAAINTGIARATGSRIGLLLSDDWLEPTAVAECARLCADIVSSGHHDYAADGATRLPHLSRTPRRDVYEALPTLEARAIYLTHFFLFDRAAVLAAGGLDESLGDAPGIDDYDLVWTLLERGATVGLTGRAVYNYRVHDGLRLTHRDRDEQVRVLARILEKHGVRGEERERLIRRHSRWFGRPEDVVAAELHGRLKAEP